jgi:hypothetical protein
MTYKRAMQNSMWINRTGSHATVPSATGRVDLMPPWAIEPEEYYNTLRGQYQKLVEYRQLLEDKVRPLKEALKRRALREDEKLREKEVNRRIADVVNTKREIIGNIDRDQTLMAEKLARLKEHFS